MEKNSFWQIKYGAIISYIVILFNMILGLIYTPWILSQIGASDYGLYTLATSLIAMFLMDFGMSAAVSRYVSLYHAEGKAEKIANFMGTIYKIYIMITVVIMIVFVGIYFFLDTMYGNLTVSELTRFKNVYIIVGATLILCFPFNTLNGILNAYEEFILQKMIDFLSKLLIVIITVVALLLHRGLYAVIIINSVITMLTVLFRIYYVRKKLGVKVNFSYHSKETLVEIGKFSGWSTLQSFGQTFVYNSVPTILAMVANTTVITMFGFANVIEGYIATICSAVDGLFLPRVSRIVTQSGDSSDILKLMIRVGRISQSVIGLLFIGIATQGKTFIHLWLGVEYEPVYYAIVILSISYLISTSQQIANNAIIAMNYIKIQSKITLATGILSVLLTFILAGRFGIIGAAVAIFIVQFLRIIGNNYIYAVKLQLNLFQFFKECHLKLLCGTFISYIIAVLVNVLFEHIFLNEGWMIFGVKSLIVCVEYIIVMWLCSWNEEEKSLFQSILPKKKV